MAITINKKKIRYTLLYGLIFIRYLLPYFFIDKESGLLNSIPFLDDALVIVSMILMAAQVLLNRFRLSKTDVLLIIVYFCLVLSTVLNQGEIVASLINAVQVLFICFTVKTLMQDETKTEVFLRLIRNIVLALFISNLVVTLVYPDGIPTITKQSDNPYYLYGNVNLTVKYIFPGLCCSLLLDTKKNKTISLPSLIFFAGYVYLCIRIYLMATGLTAVVFLLLWVFNKPIFSKNVRLIGSILIGIIVTFELLIVIVANQNLINSVLSLFGKDAGFSGRDILWERCIRCINERPFLGHGALNKEDWAMLVGNRAGSHNYYLDILFQRGILGFIPFLLFLLCPIYRGFPRAYGKSHYILIGCVFSYMIMFMFEPFYNVERFHIPVFYALNVITEYGSHKHVYTGVRLSLRRPTFMECSEG